MIQREVVMMSRVGRLVLLFALAFLLRAPVNAQSLSLKDLQFTAVQPCRIYDTRPGSGVQGQGTGPIAAGQIRDIDVSHGAAPNCGIPPQARAVVMNFIAVAPAGQGHLVAWPFGTSMPNASILNYANVAGLNIANGVVQPVCGPGCTHDLSLVPGVSATHVVIDVLGYFGPPGAGHLWGRGRPGTKMWGPGDFFCANGAIAFGLSDIAVTWGSAADACPQGTWVCTAAERGTSACDTSRPDTTCDGYLCNGNCLNLFANDHIGWLAGEQDVNDGACLSETTLICLGSGSQTCTSLPVWCCTE
ncbi:MAG TPA: hypothetical protein VGK86_07000 [Thermoanaerobaculia bacterium]